MVSAHPGRSTFWHKVDTGTDPHTDEVHELGRTLLGEPVERGARPNANLLRGAAVTVLHRLAGTADVNAPEVPSFTDVAEDDALFDVVEWAVSSGLASGYTDGTFRPMTALKRGELAALLYRYSSMM